MSKLGFCILQLLLAPWLYTMPLSAYAQCPQPDVKEVKVYGNNVQFVFTTVEQMQASETVLTGQSRVVLRFRMCDSNTPYSRWVLHVKSLDDMLYLNGGSTADDAIALNKVEIIATINTQSNNHFITISSPLSLSTTPKVLAEGQLDISAPTVNDVMEAELLLSYKLTEQTWGRKSGIYLANLHLQLDAL